MEQPLRSLPRCIQIGDVLLGQIDRGDCAPGTQVPSERALGETFSVTRMTLREALDHFHLVGRELIVRRPGPGTFVALLKTVLHPHTHTPPSGALATDVAVG